MRPHPRPIDVLRLCDRGEGRACCPEPTLTGGYTGSDAPPTRVPATFCDFVAAVRDGLAAQGRLSPAVTRSEMRPPTHVPTTFCDFVAAVGDWLAAQGRLPPAVTRSVREAVCPTFFRDPLREMRPNHRPREVLRLCVRGVRRACCPEPTLTGSHKVRDASPTHVPATFCDFVAAGERRACCPGPTLTGGHKVIERGGVSNFLSRSPPGDASPPTSQRRSVTLWPR